MSLIFRLAETPVEEEVSALPLALTMGAGVFLFFALLVFLVTRLNPDR